MKIAILEIFSKTGTSLPVLKILQTRDLGECTGISIIDSTPLISCRIMREKQYKIIS
ncbi:MAG: hypothetical protein IJ628_09400 [Bacteroidaceae bacterium]|nr:hypothetical protein [Bacteroidaceae bacterium]